MPDVMIDIETLSNKPNAVILHIAAQSFDPLGRGYDDNYLDLLIDIDSQTDRDVNDDTLTWWGSQSEAIKAKMFTETGRVTLSEALDQLHKLCWHAKRVWMQGPQFDATILENAYRDTDRSAPWQYWEIRDSRTLISLAPDLDQPPAEHDALADCRRQIVLVQDTLDFLRVRKLK